MERQAPPQLPLPVCPMCDGDTEATDTGYFCPECSASWTGPLAHGTWDDDTEPICRSTRERGGRTFHCIKHEGHIWAPWHFGAWHNGTEPVYIEWRD